MMRRSYIQRGSYEWKRSELKRSAFKTSTRSTFRESGEARTLTRKPLNPAGKKAKLRETINRRNRARFRAMGLYGVCEARLAGCWNTDLTWSHGRKDRKLSMQEREFLVIRACTPCHKVLDEKMSPEELLEFHEKVIANRKVAA